MAIYRISGVWKDTNGTITHYAMHTKTNNGTTRAKKNSKSEAIKLVKKAENKVTTWLWNYTNANWQIGEDVIVASRLGEEYLRTEPDGTIRDNLSNLINYDWIQS